MIPTIFPQSATDNPLQQLLQLQLAWQQLFWRMSATVLSSAWLPGQPAPVMIEAKPETDQHGQLVVPPAVAVEGERALFA